MRAGAILARNAFYCIFESRIAEPSSRFCRVPITLIESCLAIRSESLVEITSIIMSGSCAQRTWRFLWPRPWLSFLSTLSSSSASHKFLFFSCEDLLFFFRKLYPRQRSISIRCCQYRTIGLKFCCGKAVEED